MEMDIIRRSGEISISEKKRSGTKKSNNEWE